MTIATAIVIEEPPETQVIQEEVRAALDAAGTYYAAFRVASLAAGEVWVTEDVDYRPGCRCALEMLRPCQ